MAKHHISKDYISHFSEKELDNDIQERKAVPDLLFKYNIFKMHDEMIKAKAQMMYNKRANYAISSPQHIIRADPSDLHNLANKIDTLFCMLKYMINVKIQEYEKRKDMRKAKEDMRVYNKLCELNYGKLKKYYESDLLEMMDFLIRFMHELNFTNLLKTDIDPLQELKDSF